MDHLTTFVMRVYRAYLAHTRREELVSKYSSVLRDIELNEPHLQPLALKG